jgi:hypothetical protein
MCAQVPLRGSVEMTCDPLFGFVLDLKDPASRGSLVAYVAKAQLSMDGVKNTPHEAQGQWCFPDRHCETVKTTIIFKKFNFKKKISGTYVVEFSHGREQRGSFNAIKAAQPEPFLCE